MLTGLALASVGGSDKVTGAGLAPIARASLLRRSSRVVGRWRRVIFRPLLAHVDARQLEHVVAQLQVDRIGLPTIDQVILAASHSLENELIAINPLVV